MGRANGDAPHRVHQGTGLFLLDRSCHLGRRFGWHTDVARAAEDPLHPHHLACGQRVETGQHGGHGRLGPLQGEWLPWGGHS